MHLCDHRAITTLAAADPIVGLAKGLVTTRLRDFKALLTQVAAQDYCLVADEHELGVQALAVPLRNAEGRTIAALNSIAPPGGWTTSAAWTSAWRVCGWLRVS